jgi:hypothetical protein
MIARNYLTALIVFALVLLIFAALIFFVRASSENLNIVPTGKVEHTWQDANQFCLSQQHNWRLPNISELTGLYYFRNDVSFYPATDYWSQTRFLGYGFGLNTRTGILSYDVLDDEDHFLCVKGLH